MTGTSKRKGTEVIGEFENCRVSIHHDHQLVMAIPNWARTRVQQKTIAVVQKDFGKTCPKIVQLAPKWMRAMVYGLEEAGLLKLYSDRTWAQAVKLTHLSATTGETWCFAEEIDAAYLEGFNNGRLHTDLSQMQLRVLRDHS